MSPPMYMTIPVWYVDGLSDIMIKFSLIHSIDRPENLHLLSSFPMPVLEIDAVHLSPYSGFVYVLYLFDASGALINGISSLPESFELSHSETIRALEDHSRLNRVIKHKTAFDAESSDFAENKRYDDHFIISGL